MTTLTIERVPVNTGVKLLEKEALERLLRDLPDRSVTLIRNISTCRWFRLLLYSVTIIDEELGFDGPMSIYVSPSGIGFACECSYIRKHFTVYRDPSNEAFWRSACNRSPKEAQELLDDKIYREISEFERELLSRRGPKFELEMPPEPRRDYNITNPRFANSVSRLIWSAHNNIDIGESRIINFEDYADKVASVDNLRGVILQTFAKYNHPNSLRYLVKTKIVGNTVELRRIR